MPQNLGSAYVEATIRLDKLRVGLRTAERMVSSSVGRMQASLNRLTANLRVIGRAGIGAPGIGRAAGAPYGLLGLAGLTGLAGRPLPELVTAGRSMADLGKEILSLRGKFKAADSTVKEYAQRLRTVRNEQKIYSQETAKSLKEIDTLLRLHIYPGTRWGTWDPGISKHAPLEPRSKRLQAKMMAEPKNPWIAAQKLSKQFYQENEISLKSLGQTSGTVYGHMHRFYSQGIKDIDRLKARLEKLLTFKSVRRGFGFYPPVSPYVPPPPLAYADIRKELPYYPEPARRHAQFMLPFHKEMKRRGIKRHRKFLYETKLMEKSPIFREWEKMTSDTIMRLETQLHDNILKSYNKVLEYHTRRMHKRGLPVTVGGAPLAYGTYGAIPGSQAEAMYQMFKEKAPGRKWPPAAPPGGWAHLKERQRALMPIGIRPGAKERLRERDMTEKILGTMDKRILRSKQMKMLYQIDKYKQDWSSYFNLMKKGWKGISTAANKAAAGFGKFGGILKTIGGHFGDFDGKISGASAALLNFGKKYLKYLSAGLIAGAILIGRNAMRLEDMKRAYISLAGGQEKASKMTTTLNRGFRKTLNTTQMVQQANAAMLLGLPKTAESMGELAYLSRRLSRAMGIDVAQGFQSLAIGIGRQSRLLLDNLGIIVDAKAAYADYAYQLGKTVNELTEIERKQAFFNAAIAAGHKRVAQLGEDTHGTSDTVNKLGATLKKVGETIGTALLRVGTDWMVVLDYWTDLTREQNKSIQEQEQARSKNIAQMQLEKRWIREIAQEHDKLIQKRKEEAKLAVQEALDAAFKQKLRFARIGRIHEFYPIHLVTKTRQQLVSDYYDWYFGKLDERLRKEEEIENRLRRIHIDESKAKLEAEKNMRDVIKGEQEKYLKNTKHTYAAELLAVKRYYDNLRKEYWDKEKMLTQIAEWETAARRAIARKSMPEPFKPSWVSFRGIWEKAMITAATPSIKTEVKDLNKVLEKLDRIIENTEVDKLIEG